MSWVQRLYALVPGFGNPFVNDTFFQSVNTALTTGSNTISLLTFPQPISKGYVRIKMYGGQLTSAGFTSIQATLSDGTDYACFYYLSPSVPFTLSTTVAGTTLSTNGAMNSSSATLTSTSNPFYPSLVGATVSVPNAGNAGGTVPLQTTVATYVSSGNITLAANCLNTAGVSAKTVTLTESYFNGGTATLPGGFDVVIPFEVEIESTRLDVTVLGSGTALFDLEISGTS